MSTGDGSLRSQGLSALRQGNVDAAIDALVRAVATNDQDSDSMALLGAAYSQKGLHDSARRALETAVQLAPQNASFRYNLGFVLERAGDQTAAVAAYREALRLNPEHTQAKAKLDAMGHVAPPPAPAPPVAPPAPSPVSFGTPPPLAAGPAPFSAPPVAPPPFAPASEPPAGFTAPSSVPPPAAETAPPTFAPSPYGPYSAAEGEPPPLQLPSLSLGPPPTAPGVPPPAAGAPPALDLPPFPTPPPAAASDGKAGVNCPRCKQQSRPGMTCEWCYAPLPGAAPPPQAGPAGTGAPIAGAAGAVELASGGNPLGMKLAAGALSLVVGVGFFGIRAYMRSAVRNADQGRQEGPAASLSVGGRAVSFPNARFYLGEKFGGGNALILENEADGETVHLEFPTQATSVSQLSGQTLRLDYAQMNPNRTKIDDVPDSISGGAGGYQPYRVEAKVSAATGDQVTVSLSGTVLEFGDAPPPAPEPSPAPPMGEGMEGGSFEMSEPTPRVQTGKEVPVSGTVTLPVNK